MKFILSVLLLSLTSITVYGVSFITTQTSSGANINMTGAQYCKSFANASGFFDGVKMCNEKYGKGATYIKQNDTCSVSKTDKFSWTITGTITCNICTSFTTTQTSSGANINMTGVQYCKSFANAAGFFDGVKMCKDKFGNEATYVKQNDTCSVSKTDKFSWTITGIINCCY